MGARIFWGFVLGTLANFGLFALFATLNGTPVPSVRTPEALLSYPTGSATATWLLATVIYFLFLVITCLLVPRKKTEASTQYERWPR